MRSNEVKGTLTNSKVALTSGANVEYNNLTTTIFFNGYRATNNTSLGIPSKCHPYQIIRFPFVNESSGSMQI